jgi:hypothetical protein
MKHLKKFNLFEAVIIPNKIKDDREIYNYNQLVDYGKDNGFDVVLYEEFYKSLGEADRKTAPPKGVPFFALFHPENKRPMFVLNSPNIVRHGIKEIVDDIIGHEKIHGGQSSRRNGLSFSLPNPLKRKEYFSDKDEVMAFSWSIANGLAKKNKTIKDAFNDLKTPKYGEEHHNLWREIKSNCDQKILDRYRKYIYMYLDKILGSKSKDINSKINNNKLHSDVKIDKNLEKD